ncbi:TIGR04086 family membrane protein [Oscillospiraceae bacterium 50-58]
MKRKERRTEELGSGSEWLNVMCDVLIGGVLAGVTTILVLLVCAVLISMGVVPVGAMYGTALAACVVGALVGSIYAVRKIGRRSLLVGLGVGAVLFLLLLTAGFIVYQGASVANGGAGILCACLCGGAIPGLLGRKHKKKRRR